jgi:hypothetical protein
MENTHLHCSSRKDGGTSTLYRPYFCLRYLENCDTRILRTLHQPIGDNPPFGLAQRQRVYL